MMNTCCINIPDLGVFQLFGSITFSYFSILLDSIIHSERAFMLNAPSPQPPHCSYSPSVVQKAMRSSSLTH